MTTKRLSGLTMLIMYPGQKIDLEQVLDFFASMEQRRVDLVHAAASSLLRSSLVKYDKKTGSLQATDLGRVAAHYYVSHATISTFNEHLKEGMSDIEIFRLFSLVF